MLKIKTLKWSRSYKYYIRVRFLFLFIFRCEEL